MTSFRECEGIARTVKSMLEQDFVNSVFRYDITAGQQVREYGYTVLNMSVSVMCIKCMAVHEYRARVDMESAARAGMSPYAGGGLDWQRQAAEFAHFEFRSRLRDGTHLICPTPNQQRDEYQIEFSTPSTPRGPTHLTEPMAYRDVYRGDITATTPTYYAVQSYTSDMFSALEEAQQQAAEHAEAYNRALRVDIPTPSDTVLQGILHGEERDTPDAAQRRPQGRGAVRVRKPPTVEGEAAPTTRTIRVRKRDDQK